jgi:hypothetical protein
MTGYAPIAWFMFMLVVATLAFAGFVAATPIWGMGYFLTHDTGLEILANLLRVRFDWPSLPAEVTCWIRIRGGGHCSSHPKWAELLHAAGLGEQVFMLLLWPLLAFTIPFVAMITKASSALLPVIETFVLLGMLWERPISRVAELKS